MPNLVGRRVPDARRDDFFVPLAENVRVGAFRPELFALLVENVRGRACRLLNQSTAPMLRMCSALRRASSTTSSENIWLYLCCSSTGFVR